MGTETVEKEDKREERPKKKHRSEKRSEESEENSSSTDDDRRRRRDKKSRRKKKQESSKRSSSSRHRKKKRRKRSYSSESSSDSDSSSSSSSSSSDSDRRQRKKKKTSTKKKAVVNERLLAKLAARGETLEERQARRAEKRAAHITAKFGYTAEDNPFHDPNLAETFTWKKREEGLSTDQKSLESKKKKGASSALEEIEKVRRRRKDRELQFEEMERIKAEESRMKELEKYDEWAAKEEEFHLQQQRQRSAIRLVEGRAKPIDVLAKNILLFGLTEEEKKNRAAVKYQERYSALDALESLEAELEEPHKLLHMLKLAELEELLVDIDAFCALEREASSGMYATSTDATADNPVLRYWNALKLVAEDEISYLRSGGSKGAHAKMVEQVQKIFEGQSMSDLLKMKDEIGGKLRQNRDDTGRTFDRKYWQQVTDQLSVHLAKIELSDIHSKMLVRQLEKLEKKKEELAQRPEKAAAEQDKKLEAKPAPVERDPKAPVDVAPGFGDLEQELGLTDEIGLDAKQYSWQDKYRPRKPRYFNRVKTGYDWNKYNQTHYDHDNPPPKVVQGYKFNIFYPDLINPNKTPQYFLEPADSDDFCIIRFHAGPPYEDVAFKIINREWNRSRKRGFRCTFERGVLSLYFNFTTHWYRR